MVSIISLLFVNQSIAWINTSYQDYWSAVAISASGKYFTAVVYGGYIYTNQEYGQGLLILEHCLHYFVDL